MHTATGHLLRFQHCDVMSQRAELVRRAQAGDSSTDDHYPLGRPAAPCCGAERADGRNCRSCRCQLAQEFTSGISFFHISADCKRWFGDGSLTIYRILLAPTTRRPASGHARAIAAATAWAWIAISRSNPVAGCW